MSLGESYTLISLAKNKANLNQYSEAIPALISTENSDLRFCGFQETMMNWNFVMTSSADGELSNEHVLHFLSVSFFCFAKLSVQNEDRKDILGYDMQ